jgi:hypothetical protein
MTPEIKPLELSTKQNYQDSYRRLCNADVTEDFIESLQCAIVRAGGCFIPRSDLESQTLAGLNMICTRNSIAAIFIVPEKTKDASAS